MIIQCEKCKRKFKIDDSRITSGGSKVRCSKCGHVSFAEKKESAYEEEREGIEQEDFSAGEEAGMFGPEDVPTDNDESRELPDDLTGSNENSRLDEIPTDDSLDTTDSQHGEDEGDSVPEEKPGVVPHAEEPELNIEKVTGNEGNWEEFVNITKNEEKIDDFKMKDAAAHPEQESDFNWENLRVDNETDDIPERAPVMFEDEEPGPGYHGPNDSEDIQEQAEETGSRPEEPVNRPFTDRTPETLSVDMDVLTNNPHATQSFGGPSARAPFDSARIHPPRSKPGRGVFASIAYAFITIAVIAVILGASYVILMNMGVISKDSTDKLRELAASVAPVKFGEPSKNDVIITEHRGKWMDTRNGSLYVISGMITNKSQSPVNFVKIRSEFVSAGQILYENEVYAGNTFTDKELKVSPLQDILLKLKKRNGNIDYYNTAKLAGLNYNIQPGESIPFYTVFPSTSRVLGLRYELQIADYEDSSSK